MSSFKATPLEEKHLCLLKIDMHQDDLNHYCKSSFPFLIIFFEQHACKLVAITITTYWLITKWVIIGLQFKTFGLAAHMSFALQNYTCLTRIRLCLTLHIYDDTKQDHLLEGSECSQSEIYSSVSEVSVQNFPEKELVVVTQNVFINEMEVSVLFSCCKHS